MNAAGQNQIIVTLHPAVSAKFGALGIRHLLYFPEGSFIVISDHLCVSLGTPFTGLFADMRPLNTIILPQLLFLSIPAQRKCHFRH